MTRRTAALRLTALLLTLIAAGPTRAEFYDLEGRYECLDAPDRVCYDDTPSRDRQTTITPDLPAPSPQTDPKATPAAKTKAAKPVTSPGDNSLQAIGNRLQARKQTPEDITSLVARAKSGNAQALEMLAWCSFVGVGVPRDPVRAYFLYGRAATAGASSGRDNQQMVFKRALSPDQKQQVLEIENGSRPAPQ